MEFTIIGLSGSVGVAAIDASSHADSETLGDGPILCRRRVSTFRAPASRRRASTPALQ